MVRSPGGPVIWRFRMVNACICCRSMAVLGSWDWVARQVGHHKVGGSGGKLAVIMECVSETAGGEWSTGNIDYVKNAFCFLLF